MKLRSANSLPNVRTLLIGAAAVLVGGIVLMAWSVLDERRVTWQHSLETSQNIGSAMAQDIQRNVEIYDLSLRSVIDGLKMKGIWDVSPEMRRAVLFDGAATARDLGSLLVIDDKGNDVVESASPTPHLGNLADRDSFRVQRDRPDAGLYISGPTRGSNVGEWSIYLSRRLEHPDGSFAGIVAGSMHLAYFDRLFRSVALGKNSSIALYNTNGVLLMREPHTPNDIGRASVNRAIFKYFPQQRSGHFDIVASSDGIDRAYFYQQVGDLPLIVAVGQSPAVFLAEWRKKSAVSGIALAALLGLAGWLVMALTRELKRRGLAEQNARDSERLFRLMAEHSSDMLVRSRPGGGGRLYVSPACRRLFGYEPEEMIGGQPEDFIHPDDQEAFRNSTRKLEHSDQAVVAYRVRRKDDNHIWVEASQRRATNPETGEPEIISIVRDVSERVRNEEELRLAKESADAANQAKSEFLARMSHEIRTPMNGILGLNALLLNTPLTDRQREYVKMVDESANSLLAIVNDILDISKLEAGKVELEHVEFDLVAMVENAVMLLAPRAREKGIELCVFVEPAVRGVYRGDPSRLRQVLLNLVSNAVKFTAQGGVAIKVLSALEGGECSATAPSLRFVVIDTGIGMAEDSHGKLFQKFEQADSSMTRRFGGSGLGLAICRQLVELMDGAIGFSSKLGAGSSFWFEVPLTLSTAAPAATAVLPYRLQQSRALIVADVPILTEILSRQLRSFGIEVSTTGDGPGALAELERAWRSGAPYAVVLLDQAILGSSAALVNRIRLIAPFADTKLVLVAWAEAQNARGISDPIDAIIEKPIRQAALVDCLAMLYNDRCAVSSDGPIVAPAAAGTETASPTVGGLRILLAEDNQINQCLAVAILEHAGHQVDIADNGVEAVAAVQRKDYDVVLMDNQMPVLDGIQATRQIRALAPPKCNIPIIALTANAMAGACEQYLAAGMNDYVSKPIDAGYLRAKLEKLAAGVARLEQSSSATIARPRAANS